MLTVTYWEIFAAVALVASNMSAAIIGGCGVDIKWVRRLISWVVAIALTFGAWAINLLPGLGDPAWVFVLLQGVCIGVMSNGLYTIDAIKKFYAIVFKEEKISQ